MYLSNKCIAFWFGRRLGFCIFRASNICRALFYFSEKKRINWFVPAVHFAWGEHYCEYVFCFSHTNIIFPPKQLCLVFDMYDDSVFGVLAAGEFGKNTFLFSTDNHFCCGNSLITFGCFSQFVGRFLAVFVGRATNERRQERFCAYTFGAF